MFYTFFRLFCFSRDIILAMMPFIRANLFHVAAHMIIFFRRRFAILIDFIIRYRLISQLFAPLLSLHIIDVPSFSRQDNYTLFAFAFSRYAPIRHARFRYECFCSFISSLPHTLMSPTGHR